MKTKFLVPLFLLSALIACKKSVFSVPETDPAIVPGSIEELKANPSFTFNTGSEINLSIRTLDNTDQPVPGMRINIYTDYPESGGKMIAAFVTGSNGAYTSKLRIPAATDSLVIQTPALGFVSVQKRQITNGTLHCTLGGRNPLLNGRAAYPEPVVVLADYTQRTQATPPIKAIGSYNTNGVPNYLVTPNDVVDAAFINDINTALPESRPVPTYHPQYISSTAKANLEFQLPSHVWVTFVHEGAGYRNVLCYYTYNLSNPPATVNDIDTLRAIFPNVSYVNSGGGLVSGNKVELGTFQPGTGIGWAIIANGYNGSSFTTSTGVYYSDANLNPETNPDLKKHCILLNDLNRDKLILSFEDLNRSTAGCDNDFNDAVFYVTADPIQSVISSNIVLPAYTSNDDDGDGVMNNFDEYPNDPTKAFNNYYPSQNTNGTLAFEDLWPSKGDYDFNDMVIDYNFNPVTNAANQVVQINASFTVKATGAGYHNGFGFQVPINPNLIASVTGTDIRGNLVTLNANGTEAGQSKATFIVFDDAFNRLPWPGTGIGVNTTIGAPYVNPTTMNIVINLATPVDAQQLGLPPYNAFIFTDRTRSKEIHLVNQVPTDLANLSLLGTQHDNSNPAIGRYYRTANNLPFAIDIFSPFDYPVEKGRITDAHLKFYSWVASGGLQFTDWYKPIAGYRNPANIFTH